MATIRFNDIHKTYGKTVALRGVSFDVLPGEVFGLLGPNGAGKSTLIRILLDIIRADSGSIDLFGEPHRREALDRISFLPEERGLYDKLKIIKVMVYLAQLKGMERSAARTTALEWLERMKLGHAADWKIERLSKGMTQKVQIAVTMMTEPELCVLDEPFSGLDPVNVRLVRELIAERRSKGLTTMLSTHQMREVESLCDRVGMINNGKRVLYGAVEEVREAHSTPQVYLEMAGEPPAHPLINEAWQENGGWHLSLQEGADSADVLRGLVESGASIHHYRRVLTPIEDIFVKVVAEGETQ